MKAIWVSISLKSRFCNFRVSDICHGCRALEYDYFLSEGVGGKGGNQFIFINDLTTYPIPQIKWDTNRYGLAYLGMIYL